MDAYSINGFTEGERMAYRPITCRIGPDPEQTVLYNHFHYERVPLTEVGTRIDQREKETRHEATTP